MDGRIVKLYFLHPAAGVHITVGQDGQVAVAAIAAAVNHAGFGVSGDLKLSDFVFVERPKMVFLVEVGLTALGLVLLEFPVAVGQKLPVSQRLDAYIFFFAGGAVAGKGEHVGFMLHHRVDNAGNLVYVCAGNSGHNHRFHARFLDGRNLL